MDSEPDPEPSSTPKLSLFSLPSQSPEPPGMLTPPLRPPASVPFQWEEAPGKPRTYTTNLSKASSARYLELPPRLFLTESKSTNIPSPTTVLDGPYVGRSVSYSASFSGERQSSFSSLERGEGQSKDRGYFVGYWGKKGLKGNRNVGEDNFDISSTSSSSLMVGDGGVVVGSTKVKITRFKRSGSFLSLSQTRSNLWASIYGTLKQVVPWNGRKKKKDGPTV